MQSIVSKGKNVKEAIELGLELLDLTKKEVSIEIIQHETKGFLRMKSKEAVVKITENEEKSQGKMEDKTTDSYAFMEQFVQSIPEVTDLAFQEQGESEPTHVNKKSDLAGKVWVKNGEIHCQPSPTHLPIVSISDGIHLYKNNQRIKEKTCIMADQDFYEIKVKNEVKETKWNITLDQHKLNVFLHVEPGCRIIRSVLDIEPDHHIELKTEEKKEIYNTLTYQEIIEKLESLRVKHGFNQDEIVKAMEAVTPGTYTIASGTKAKPGKNGWVELQINMETKKGLIENEDGRVDYRETQINPNVQSGTVIAIVHPPIPGQPGRTVTNEPLLAKQTVPVLVKEGKGVMVVTDKAVATNSGRPHLEQRGQMAKISIMPKLNHPGNVNLASGNIHFMGDVEVFGEVCERMKVDAEGDIIVHQSVNMATIEASGAIITHGNIIGSEVSSGKNNMLVAELGHLLGNINRELEKIIEVIEQLTLSPGFKTSDFSHAGLQPLIRILLEKKFKNFPSLVKKYVDVARKGENYLVDEEWQEVAVSLSHLFLYLSNEITSIVRMTELSIKMSKLYKISQTPIEPESYITIPYALNSRLYSSGNILVHGKGSINTKIHSGGLLKIIGVLRGGEVYGRSGVDINEVGAESGTLTMIAVPDDQQIRINKAMEGTTIKIGNVQHKFEETRYQIAAKLNKEGKIVFE